MKQRPEDVRVGLSQGHTKLIRDELTKQGKNPDKKKSEFIRALIENYNSDELFFTESQLQILFVEFANLTRLGSNINQLLYHINIEHIEYIQGNKHEYCLNSDLFADNLEEIKTLLIDVKESLRKTAVQKRWSS